MIGMSSVTFFLIQFFYTGGIGFHWAIWPSPDRQRGIDPPCLTHGRYIVLVMLVLNSDIFSGLPDQAAIHRTCHGSMAILSLVTFEICHLFLAPLQLVLRATQVVGHEYFLVRSTPERLLHLQSTLRNDQLSCPSKVGFSIHRKFSSLLNIAKFQ